MKELFSLQHEGVLWHTLSIEEVENALSDRYTQNAIKSDDQRTLTAIIDRKNDPAKFFLKKRQNAGLKGKLKSFVSNKSREEFESYLLLKSLHIPTIDYVAWGRSSKETFILSKGSKALDVKSVWKRLNLQNKRHDFIEGLADMILKLICLNIYHPALTLNNILVNELKFGYQFILVDLSGVKRVKKLSREQKLSMLSVITPFIPHMQFQKQYQVLKKLSSLFDATSWQELIIELANYLSKERNKIRQKSQWKFIQRSDQLNRYHREEGTWRIYKQSGISIEYSLRAIRSHLTALKENGEMLKVDKKRRLSRFKERGISSVIKEFVSPGPWGKWAADHRSWLSSFGLTHFEIPAATPLAWLKTSRGQSYIILEDLGDLDLYSALNSDNSSLQFRHQLLLHTGRLVGWLHLLGIYHRDLKTVNFMVCPLYEEENFELKLIDLDDIQFSSKICQRRRLKNIMQVIESLPENVTHNERLRMLAAYRKMSCLTKEQVKELVENL